METHFIFFAFFLSLRLSYALCVYLTFIAYRCSIYIPKVKLWLLQINIEDQISINSKIHIIKTYFNWMEICSNFIEIALRHGYSPVNLLHIFRTPFPKSTSGWLLLKKDSVFRCRKLFHWYTIAYCLNDLLLNNFKNLQSNQKGN